jgi:hypothetical protein
MKKILSAVAVSVSCFFVACNNSGTSSGNNKNISVAHEIFQGIETGDTNKLVAIAPDAVDHAGPMGEVTNGDSIKGMLREMHNHVRDLKIEVLGDAVNGDYVYSWTRMSGTALDSSMGFQPNMPFNVRSVDIIKFRDGKAVEHWGFVDQQDLMSMRAQQMPNATTVKVTMGDTSANKKDTTKK